MRLPISTAIFSSWEKTKFMKRKTSKIKKKKATSSFKHWPHLPLNAFSSLQRQKLWPFQPPVTKQVFSVAGSSLQSTEFIIFLIIEINSPVFHPTVITPQCWIFHVVTETLSKWEHIFSLLSFRLKQYQTVNFFFFLNNLCICRSLRQVHTKHTTTGYLEIW